LRKHPEAINLLTNPYIEESRGKFEEFKRKIKGFTTATRDRTKAGEIVLFYNGYGVKMFTEVLGFDEDGNTYLLWDCYWYPINLKERRIQLSTNPFASLLHLINESVNRMKGVLGAVVNPIDSTYTSRVKSG
jgi:hypothetical protein